MLERLHQLFFGSVRRRMILGVAMVHAVMMSMLIWDLNIRHKKTLLEQQREQAKFLAQSISRSAAGWLVARDVAGLQEIISAQTKGPDVIYAMALDPQGLVLAHTDASRKGQYVVDLPKHANFTVMNNNAKLVDVISPAKLDGRLVGWIRIGVGQSHARMQLAAINRDGVIYTMVAILIGIVIAYVMGTRLTRRLYAIRTTADAIMKGHLSERVPVKGIDEAEQLAQRFNDMLDAISRGESDLQKSNRELASKEQILSQAQTIGHLGSWVYDLSKDELEWSSETYKIFGLDPVPKDKLYQTFVGCIHQDDRDAVLEAYNSSQMPGVDGYEIEHRIVRRNDGAIRYMHEKCQHIRDEQGNVIRSIGMVQDITDKVNDVAKITENELRLKAILKTASDGIAVVSPDATLLDASDSFLQDLGYDEGAIGHKKVWDWNPGMSHENILKFLEKLIATQSSQVVETKHVATDGTEFWVEVHSRGVNILGQDMIFSAIRNIDARKHAEAERDYLQTQLVQSQKMEAIGQLTGGIAHDFNNMLAAIVGYAQLLEITDPSYADKSSRQAKYLNQILGVSNRAKELISKMLVFSRVQRMSDSDELPVVMLDTMLQEVVQLLKSSIPSSVKVRYHISDDSLRSRAEPVQLHQILLNLAINARDAIGDYGTITLSLDQEHLSDYCDACHEKFDGEYNVISVSDNGTGIPENMLANIFDPFFTTKEVGKGTGMGLSVVHGMVHALNGHVRVDSKLDTGTTFKVYLPVVESLPQADADDFSVDESIMNSLNGVRIMLIDDEEALVNMLHAALNEFGAQVDPYTLPQQAFRQFSEHPDDYDLVITDETMPELTGLDLARKMLKIRPNLPIVLCTGYSAKVDDKVARENGIAAFLNKPVGLKELILLVNQLLS